MNFCHMTPKHQSFALAMCGALGFFAIAQPLYAEARPAMMAYAAGGPAVMGTTDDIELVSLNGGGSGCRSKQGHKNGWGWDFDSSTGILTTLFGVFRFRSQSQRDVYCNFRFTAKHKRKNARIHLYQAQIFGRANLPEFVKGEAKLKVFANGSQYQHTYAIERGFVGVFETPIYQFPDREDRPCDVQKFDVKVEMSLHRIGDTFGRLSIGGRGPLPQPVFFMRLVDCD